MENGDAKKIARRHYDRTGADRVREDAGTDGDTHSHAIAAADCYGYPRADRYATADGHATIAGPASTGSRT